MINFVIYDTVLDKIIKYGKCQDGDFEVQVVGSNEIIASYSEADLPEEFNHLKYRVDVAQKKLVLRDTSLPPYDRTEIENDRIRKLRQDVSNAFATANDAGPNPVRGLADIVKNILLTYLLPPEPPEEP